jgi:hypothetical protein
MFTYSETLSSSDHYWISLQRGDGEAEGQFRRVFSVPICAKLRTGVAGDQVEALKEVVLDAALEGIRLKAVADARKVPAYVRGICAQVLAENS